MLVSIEQVKKLKNHDQHAFNEIYQAYYRLAFCLAQGILHDYYAAEDIVQEAFIKMMKNITNLKNNQHFHQYFLQIVKNLAFNEQKRKKDIPSETMDDHAISVDDKASIFEKMHSYLDGQENAIVIYKLVYDCTFQEISQILNISPSSAYRFYLLAIKKIKKHYKESL